MDMTPQEIEAIGILRCTNTNAWDIYIGYIAKLLNSEKNKCMYMDKEKVQINQGRARAFEEVMDIEFKAEAIYNSKKGR